MNNGAYLKAMGGKIKSARLERKQTLKSVSQSTGIHLTSIWFIESGKTNPHLLSLKAIADTFKMDVKDFL